jgi:hypothetical protein
MATGEKSSSANLEIFVFECDMTYDPAIMEDAYGDGRQSGGKRASEAIVGTTGIGLVEVRSVKREGCPQGPNSDSCQNCAHIDFE